MSINSPKTNKPKLTTNTADEFDPDNFDWDDDTEGIRFEDLAASGLQVDEVIQQAYEYMCTECFDYQFKTAPSGKITETSKRVFSPQYQIPAEHRDWVKDQFPGYNFVWDAAKATHDHPISHLATELNELEMVESWTFQGRQYIDLFGNASRCRKYKRNAFVLYDKKTPKDFLRYQEAGEHKMCLPYDIKDLLPGGKHQGIDCIAMTHSLYYLSLSELAQIVGVSPGRRLRALVHRHPGTHGFLNKGEIEYWVSEDGMVTQMNVLTGERYTHPSLEALFHQDSARTEHGGVAWTMRKVGGDTFCFDFVRCDGSVAKDFVPLAKLDTDTRVSVVTQGVTVHQFLHWTWVTAESGKDIVKLEDVELLEKLRRLATGKQRDKRLRDDLFVQGKRLCNKADIISIHGGGASSVTMDRLHLYVNAAMYMDVHKELEAAIAFHKANSSVVAALNKWYSEGVIPKDIAKVQHTVKTVGSLADPVTAAALQLLGSTVLGGFRLQADGLATLSQSVLDALATKGVPKPSSWLIEPDPSPVVLDFDKVLR